MRPINVKMASIDVTVSTLSGGNQQKVVLSKWMLRDPKEILILDEPTRGIDVGAKFEIYKLMTNLVKEGKSIIMVSSELSELIGMCDRIYVMAAGRIAGELEQGGVLAREDHAIRDEYWHGGLILQRAKAMQGRGRWIT